MLDGVLANGTDLNLWANSLEARAALPRLIRRLVLATALGVRQLGFPADEGVQLGGWDGLVVSEDGDAFVPVGLSVWELGTNVDIKGKADDDYDKRRRKVERQREEHAEDDKAPPLDPRGATFVFVTPRRWGGKDDWLEARRAEGFWREVRAYDADDLGAWLEDAPAVHLWLSRLLGKLPGGARDLSGAWEEWAGAVTPPLSQELIRAGRGAQVEAVADWLGKEPSTLAVKGDTRAEAIAFLGATLERLPSTERDFHLARSVVVSEPRAWETLASSRNRLLLVPDFDDRRGVAAATRAGHRVFAPLGRDDPDTASAVVLPRSDRDEAKEALVAMGFSEDRAGDLATLARRSLSALRRRLAPAPGLEAPAWASPPGDPAVLSALMVGAWDDGNEADRAVVARLAGLDYGEVSRRLVGWANAPDPPVRRTGRAWLVSSKDDGWSLLARFLTPDDLDAFEALVLEVLGTPDPIYEVPPDQRWMAGPLGKGVSHSGYLREGLADTLALMGARDDAVMFADGSKGQPRADRAVRRLLAADDWRRWASASGLLPLLAEASPGAFLEAAERAVSGEEPLLPKLFNEDEGGISTSSPHTGLLWALELVAWHPDHFSRAAVILAKLARLDPGGKLANRPGRSLREVFLPWLPQTLASLEQRLRVLDTLRKREPRVTWPLLKSLLPQPYDTASPTSKPRYREWLPDHMPRASYSELERSARELTLRMLEDAGKDGPRWADLLDTLAGLPESDGALVLAALDRLDPDAFELEDRVNLWAALRELISRHTEFANQPWALPAEDVVRLQATYARFQPEDVIAKHAWLFTHHPSIIGVPDDDWMAQAATVDKRRLEAVGEVLAGAGLEGLVNLAARVEVPGELGRVIGAATLLETEEAGLLSAHLGAGDDTRRNLARGFVIGRFRSRGWGWVEAALDRLPALPPEQRAEFFYCLPFEGRTWDLVERQDAETQRLYWSRAVVTPVDGVAERERAINGLLEHGRPHSAVHFLGVLEVRDQNLPVAPDLVARALELAAQTSVDQDPTANSSMLQHHISKLLVALEADERVPRERIVQLEWIFLPLFSYRERAPRALEKELATNPEFFAELVAWAYKPEHGEPPELSDQERGRARSAYTLLSAWRRLPGQLEDGSLDGGALLGWVGGALEATQARDRASVGAHHVGSALTRSPVGNDGVWPHEAIRDALDDHEDEALGRGFEMGVYNSRGVTVRGPTDGGEQERQLAERYRAYAVALTGRWPRTASLLRGVAQWYEDEARREDAAASLTQDTWR